MFNKTPQQVEQELLKLLKQYKLTSKLSVQKVKDWIYNSSGSDAMEEVNRYQKHFLNFFADKFKKVEELSGITQVLTDAWNVFPQKALGGKSPNQMPNVTVDVKGKATDKEVAGRDKRAMPKMVVGGLEMDWNEYWAMIKEMERLQIPFKSWIEKDLLPKYKKYLSQTFNDKIIDKHFAVADLFFQRILHVGFLRLEEVRPGFIQKEFPHWWQTHVLMDSLKEKAVLSSLKKLFEFIELVYKISKNKFGF